MDICKELKKNSNLVIGVLGLVILAYALYSYSQQKFSPSAGLKNLSPSVYNGKEDDANVGASQHFANASAADSMGSSVNNMLHLKKDSVDPSDLLPKDNNNEYSKMNPSSSLQGLNMLTPGNDVFDSLSSTMSTNRNPNLQLRSEPPNPQTQVCAWNQTTITPDVSRRQLEIGSA